jgi:hypothetical protein
MIPCQVGLNIVRHDWQRQDLHFRSRFYNPKAKKQRALPETVRLFGGRGNVELTKEWMDYWEFINGDNPKVMKYLLRRDSGIINKGNEPFVIRVVNGFLDIVFKTKKYPRVETLTFGGSAVKVWKIEGSKAFVETLHVDHTPPRNKVFPPVQRFMAIRQDGILENPPCGATYTFLIARENESLWIPTHHLAYIGS